MIRLFCHSVYASWRRLCVAVLLPCISTVIRGCVVYECNRQAHSEPVQDLNANLCYTSLAHAYVYSALHNCILCTSGQTSYSCALLFLVLLLLCTTNTVLRSQRVPQ
jgi:hypothetical protein